MDFTKQQAADIWSVTHPSRPGGCVSSIPYCGYDRDTLSGMIGLGFIVQCNGKKVALPPKTAKAK